MEGHYEKKLLRISKNLQSECSILLKSMNKVSKLLSKFSDNFFNLAQHEMGHPGTNSEEKSRDERKSNRTKPKAKKKLLGVKRKRDEGPRIQGRILKIRCVDANGYKVIGYKIQSLVHNVKTELGPFLSVEFTKGIKTQLYNLLKESSIEKKLTKERARKIVHNFRDEIYENNPPLKTAKLVKLEASQNAQTVMNINMSQLKEEDKEERDSET